MNKPSEVALSAIAVSTPAIRRLANGAQLRRVALLARSNLLKFQHGR